MVGNSYYLSGSFVNYQPGLLTLIPFVVSKGETWGGGLLPDLHSNPVSWVLILASQWGEEGRVGRRPGLEASALLTSCANWGQPLLPLRSVSPLCRIKRWTALTSKSPASFHIPGFLFYSAFNSPSKSNFQMVKLRSRKDALSPVPPFFFLKHLTHHSKIPEIWLPHLWWFPIT